MKASKTKLLAAAVAVAAIGSAYAHTAEALPAPSSSPAVVQIAADSLGNGYHFAVLTQPQYQHMSGRAAETNPSHDDVAIGLVRDSDGQIVRGVDINALAFDMSPDGMRDMGARINFNGRYAGVYHLKLYPTMAGNWAIHLSAQVPNVATPVQATLTVALAR